MGPQPSRARWALADASADVADRLVLRRQRLGHAPAVPATEASMSPNSASLPDQQREGPAELDALDVDASYAVANTTVRTLAGQLATWGAQMTTGDEARFEFRVWDVRLDGVSERLRALADAGDVRESAETYVVSTAVVDANPKARADLLDIKVLVDVRDGFEQWTVHGKAEFPVDAGTLTDDLFPLLGVAPPSLDRKTYSLSELVHEVVEQHPELAAVDVAKRRQMYSVDTCQAEVSEVRMRERTVQTVAIESADLDALREFRRELGLETNDNVSYPRAIRDMLGGRFAVR